MTVIVKSLSNFMTMYVCWLQVFMVLGKTSGNSVIVRKYYVDTIGMVSSTVIRHCHIGQDEIHKNMETFMKGILPSIPLFIYTRKQENCQGFAADAWVPISKQTVVATGTKHTIQCGDFTNVWKEWTCHLNINKTWPN